MAVHALHYEIETRLEWGVLRGDAVLPIPGEFPTTGDFVRNVNVADLEALDGATVPLANLRVLSPVTRNQRFVCQGANYRQHMIESGMNPDDKNFNMIFTKAPSCIVAADSDIIRPPVSQFLDYEIELGLILAKDIGRSVDVTNANLHEFVAGIVMVNDVTARDIQVPQMQFYKGKSFRTFGPVGPWLCLLGPDEMHYVEEMELRLAVNGDVRQQDSSANLVFKPGETLTELSQVHDFAAGDLLSTGTPAGCALTVPPPMVQRLAGLLPEATKWKIFLKKQAARTQYLKIGDRIESTIRSRDGKIDLGVQRNLVVQG
ncbi:MAG: 2,4-diketo-3-deoxy-L-fuconate hydrolase [Candidatus Binatia bacterium]|jgi:2,4-diketo-3-deoxy-L-fuconate hydrolase